VPIYNYKKGERLAMQENLEFAQRLKTLQGDRKVVEFARFLEVNNSTLWNYLEGRIPPADFLAMVIKKTGVSGHWLLTGDGEMYVPGKEPVALREKILKIRAAASAAVILILVGTAFAAVHYQEQIMRTVYGSSALDISFTEQIDRIADYSVKVIGEQKIIYSQRHPVSEEISIGELLPGTDVEVEVTAFDDKNRPLRFGRANAVDLVRDRTAAASIALIDIYPPATPQLDEQPPAITAAKKLQLSGTKEPGTAILLAGKLLVPAGDDETFTVEIPLDAEGDNALRIEAVDAAGNVSQPLELAVKLDTTAPASPRVNTLPPATNKTQQLLSGSREPGSAIVLNGRIIAEASDSPTWAASYRLNEGFNILKISAVDAVGNHSRAHEARIYLDTNPPAAPSITE
jgi:Bacteriophage CI repressor helix-turn-helix domain